MAAVSDVPEQLAHHAEQMPREIREAMSPEELRFRLAYVEHLMQDADSIGNPAVSRQLRAKARRVRDAMPYAEYHREMERLKKARTEALGGPRDVWRGYCDAIRSLEESHPQPAGVSQAVYLAERGRVPQDTSEAKTVHGMTFKRAALIEKLVAEELVKVEAKYAEEAARLRSEIAALKNAANAGGDTPGAR